MNMTVAPAPGFPVSNTQWEQLQSLAHSLSPEQAHWASGYFAGVGQALRSSTSILPSAAVAGVPDRAAVTGSAAPSLTILYGSETGNSADLARRVKTQAEAKGIKVAVADMAGYKTRQLKDEQDLLLVVSTHGEGDAPEPAAEFFEFLFGRKAPKLAGIRFAVLGLGDSTYEHFCGAAKRLDERFLELGAERLADRIDCDVDYEDPAASWVEQTLAGLAAKAASASIAAAPFAHVPPVVGGYDKRRPFLAPVIENIVITGRGSSKETRHIELSLEGSGLSYRPGDALGVVPRNDGRLIDRLLATAGLNPSDAIEIKAQPATLADALSSHFEITALTPRFIEHWAKLSGASELSGLLGEGRRGELTAYMGRNHIVDLVEAFPVKGLTAADLAAGLRTLQPRLYSIASSANLAEDEVHMTVSTLRYDLNGSQRGGVASTHLATLTEEDATLPVYIQENPHFRLPENPDRPVIMIGAGTGVAPYRAFLQEREASDASSPAWLFFGERNFRTDFLYQVEWQRHLDEGRLSRLDLAFSRDQAEKTYVHHRMREQGRDLYDWLENGAHVYVCGDAEGLAPDVHRALTEIVAEQARVGAEEADAYIRYLQRDGRYQRDVY
jgi:sulfite reductase (NADPH) flavoprotein alpha-component